jgi:hypothetical protein
MSDELERLRDVARAATAFIKADDEWSTHVHDWPDRTDAPPVEDIREGHRLSDVCNVRRAELVAALARLAELGPPPA